MKRALRWIALGVCGLLVALFAAGMLADPRIAAEGSVRVDAPPAEVFAVLLDPRLRPRWFAALLGAPIEEVEILAADGAPSPGRGGSAAERPRWLDLGLTFGVASDAPTHRYRLAGGAFVDARVLEVVAARRYVERLVDAAPAYRRLVRAMTWRFELRPAADDPQRTELTIALEGRAGRPLGVLLERFVRWIGGHELERRRVGREIAAIIAERLSTSGAKEAPGRTATDQREDEQP